MKVVYHHRFKEIYADDPAAAAGRMESILREVTNRFELVAPDAAKVDDILLVHSDEHIKYIRGMGLTYDIALLSTGGPSKPPSLQ
jgi:acetoin utilization deacetylase AcuC-like enzyme